MERLEAFLARKGEAYHRIDTARMPRVWAQVKGRFSLPPVIHLVGTNGKGSTGRFLAGFLRNRGHSVGHYTSPHILKFNERFWQNGADLSDETLEAGHRQLMERLGEAIAEELSYFEYATLLAALLFEKCDHVIMEAGLGGEFDATAVFPARLLLVTPIGPDHQAFLGETVEEIAATKLRVIRCETILGEQPEPAVETVARRIGQERNHPVFGYKELLPGTLPESGELPPFMAQNLHLAVAAAVRLGLPEPWKGWDLSLRLPGRMMKFRDHITLDVGHNLPAARALLEAFRGNEVSLVYNTFKDKEYRSILQTLKPILREVRVLEIEGERALAPELLEAALEELGIPHGPFESATPEKTWLVFGSFSVVEAFLTRFYAG